MNINAMPWPKENERAFIGILYEYVKVRHLQCSAFTNEDWGKINQDLLKATKRDYGIEQLKGKWNHLQSTQKLFATLLGHTGVTWDPNINQVNATKEVWQHFYALNNEYKLFRNEGCEHYRILCELFTGTSATEGLGNASTAMSPALDKERDMEDDFLNKGMHVPQENNDVAEVAGGTSTCQRENDTILNERCCKEPKINKSDKLAACMDQCSSSFDQRDEEVELRKIYMREKVAALPSKLQSSQGSGIQGNGSQAISAESDPYSVIVCMDILNNIEGLSDDAYAKGVTAFDRENFRMIFVMMPDHRRAPVLERL